MFCFRYMFFSQPYPKKRAFLILDVPRCSEVPSKIENKNFEKKQISKKSLKKCAHPLSKSEIFVSSFWGPTGSGREIPPPPAFAAHGPNPQAVIHLSIPRHLVGSGHVNVAMAKCECEVMITRIHNHSVAANSLVSLGFISFALLSSSIHDFLPVASEISKSQLRPKLDCRSHVLAPSNWPWGAWQGCRAHCQRCTPRPGRHPP